jgi:hypothetical protein
MTITKDDFFKPGKIPVPTKASTTDQAARQIIAAEAVQRDAKTERLRLLRETQQADTIAVPTVRGKKAARAK